MLKAAEILLPPEEAVNVPTSLLVSVLFIIGAAIL